MVFRIFPSTECFGSFGKIALTIWVPYESWRFLCQSEIDLFQKKMVGCSRKFVKHSCKCMRTGIYKLRMVEMIMQLLLVTLTGGSLRYWVLGFVNQYISPPRLQGQLFFWGGFPLVHWLGSTKGVKSRDVGIHLTQIQIKTLSLYLFFLHKSNI